MTCYESDARAPAERARMHSTSSASPARPDARRRPISSAAHKWFNLAAMKGHAEAARMRREIATEMTDGEIGQAQRAARDWLKSQRRRKRRPPRSFASPPDRAVTAAARSPREPPRRSA